MLIRNADERSTSIRERAEIFRQQNLPKTSEVLLRLAQALQSGNNEQRLPLFEQILKTFRDEYAGGDADFLALYDFIETITIRSVVTMKQSFRDKLRELSPLIEQMRKSASVMGKIGTAFLKARYLNDEERFYAACIIHAMDVEGQFDEACRLLYVLLQSFLEKNIGVSDIQDLSLRELRNKMKDLTKGESEILFLGWQDGHLRNSIAHMRLEYNDSKSEMRFIDIDRDGNTSYDRVLSFSEFSKFFHLTNGVSIVFLDLVILLGARDMAFATEFAG